MCITYMMYIVYKHIYIYIYIYIERERERSRGSEAWPSRLQHTSGGSYGQSPHREAPKKC